MWKIHRYYLKEIGVNGVLTFVVLFGIALISLLYKGIRLVQGGGLLDAALTTLLLAVDIFPHLLTFSLLFGTVLTFARASQDREITAIRALGISPRVPMVSAMLIGLFCSLVATWALHYKIPLAHYHKYRVVADIYSGRIKSYIDDQDRIVLDKDGVMTWQRKEREGDHDVYLDVTIYSGSEGILGKLTGGSIGTLIIADRVRFEVDEAARTITMVITDFYIPTTGYEDSYASLKMDLVNILKGLANRNAGVKDLPSDLLLSEVYRNHSENPMAARYTVHRRACFALIPFLLAPIGFCIGVLSRERGRVLALSFCMIPLAVVYLADFLGESALRHLEFPLLGWLPTAVTLLGGVPFCWRLLRV